MEKLPLDTVLTLMRRENVLGHGFDLDELVNTFVVYVKDPMSQEQVELSLAQCLFHDHAHAHIYSWFIDF